MVNLNLVLVPVGLDGLFQLILLNYLNYYLEENNMGWKGSEIEMPVGMIFKRMFCHKCCARLKKEKITKIYKKG